ncbi:MAG: hypothetical protein SF028_14825 [Candidatus Sumerlaeia bacterium]|nr:hypothetical protein [Candidatus Sumerlaeia bacterium]
MAAAFHALPAPLREIRRRPPPPLGERVAAHAAGFLAVALLLAALAIRTATIGADAPPDDEWDVTIVLDDPAVPPVEQPLPMDEPAPFEEAAATRLPDAAQEDAEDLVEELAQSAPGLFDPLPEAAPDDRFATWVPKAAERGRLAELHLEIGEEAAGLRKRKGEMAQTLERHAVDAAAREFSIVSDGGLAGVIRTIDLSDLPEEEAEAALRRRYDISIETRHIRPQAGRSFLNAATTREGTYTTATATEGTWDVFTLSPKAIGIMAALEVRALAERGYDPTTSRVRTIRFGMRRDEFGDWALAVLDLEAERIR